MFEKINVILICLHCSSNRGQHTVGIFKEWIQKVKRHCLTLLKTELEGSRSLPNELLPPAFCQASTVLHHTTALHLYPLKHQGTHDDTSKPKYMFILVPPLHTCLLLQFYRMYKRKHGRQERHTMRTQHTFCWLYRNMVYNTGQLKYIKEKVVLTNIFKR